MKEANETTKNMENTHKEIKREMTQLRITSENEVDNLNEQIIKHQSNISNLTEKTIVEITKTEQMTEKYTKLQLQFTKYKVCVIILSSLLFNLYP